MYLLTQESDCKRWVGLAWLDGGRLWGGEWLSDYMPLQHYSALFCSVLYKQSNVVDLVEHVPPLGRRGHVDQNSARPLSFSLSLSLDVLLEVHYITLD